MGGPEDGTGPGSKSLPCTGGTSHNYYFNVKFGETSPAQVLADQPPSDADVQHAS